MGADSARRGASELPPELQDLPAAGRLGLVLRRDALDRRVHVLAEQLDGDLGVPVDGAPAVGEPELEAAVVGPLARAG